MGKMVEKNLKRRRKKKKGRPSLLDLQKRNLKQQQQQQQLQLQKQQQKRSRKTPNNKKPAPHPSQNHRAPTPTPLRRSTRRNPALSSPDEDFGDDEDEEELSGKRRRKKLKLVLKLHSESETNSASSESNGSGSENGTASFTKKRKINAIGDGSAASDSEKEEKSVSGTNPTTNVQDLGPSTPLPDKNLLLFILDRLQKKDTYGVFSEPVDPEELPDYHEVIEHPMDFGTVRNKLSSGAYANLEQFEKDVLLICSNAMRFNASDTIYFRQARSIQELATKNFANLRQDSDDNEPEPKVVRRGRPPTKLFKRPPGRPLLERTASEFSSDVTLATGGESNVRSSNDLRKGPLSEKSAFPDSSGRFHNSCSDAHFLAEIDEATGSILGGHSMEHGKKQFALDENRRNTYKQFHPSAGVREPSVLTAFDTERKQLMAVGLLSEHGYARSLARFAANIGLVAWKIALKKIKRSLPPEVKFGPGWVGEKDPPPQRPWLISSPFSSQTPLCHPSSLPRSSSNVATSCTVVITKEKLLEISIEDKLPNKQRPINQSASEQNSSVAVLTPHLDPGKSEPNKKGAEAVEGLHSLDTLNSSMGVIGPRPPFQFHQSPTICPGMNGSSGVHGFNLPAQMGKEIAVTTLPGLNFQSSRVVDMVSRTSTNFVNPATANSVNSESSKLQEKSSATNSSGASPNPGSKAKGTLRSGLQGRQSWQVLAQRKPDSALSPKQKSYSIPLDLNVRFQSPGSPSSSRVDSAQPDLALQL